MAKKSKKTKLKPTRSGAQIYMSDSYAKEFDDSIKNRESTDLRKLMEKKIREKMYAEGATPQEVGQKLADVTTDQIAEAVRITNKAKGGAVRAMKLGGAVMKGRGPKFKGQS